jgi:hypothetical protein
VEEQAMSTKQEALDLIDEHKNRLVDPVAMLRWTILRVTILEIPEGQWDEATYRAAEVCSR